VTNTNVKTAEYHFTTLSPNLGVASYYDKQIVIADIPGLIEGASQGKGLGDEFLKHIERTKLLFHIVDISWEEGQDPVQSFETIMNELADFGHGLTNKEIIVCGNKIDINGENESFADYIKAKGLPYFEISTVTKDGISELIKFSAKKLDEILISPEDIDEEYEKYEVGAIENDSDYVEIKIEKDGELFSISGKQLEKIFRSTNFSDYESIRYFYKYLEDRGAIEKLLTGGVKNGDDILICGRLMEFQV
jgi:GTP-binding protein